MELYKKNIHKYLRNYNRLFINYKRYPGNENNTLYLNNINNINNNFSYLNNLLNEYHNNIDGKKDILDNANDILEFHKQQNISVQDKIKEIKNTNQASQGMLNDVTHLFVFNIIEYVIIIIGMGVILYDLIKKLNYNS
jgi:predicted PurR-regulated permease PerM